MIGIRPTFDDKFDVSYEIHIFNFDQNLYDQKLKVDICFFVRPEITFSTLQELIKQIHQDINQVRQAFSLRETEDSECSMNNSEVHYHY